MEESKKESDPRKQVSWVLILGTISTVFRIQEGEVEESSLKE